jgi:hypothetical protein
LAAQYRGETIGDTHSAFAAASNGQGAGDGNGIVEGSVSGQ